MKVSTARLKVTIFVVIGLLGFQVACDSAEQKVAPPSGVSSDRPLEHFEFDSGAQLEQLINDLNYTPEAWQAGIREVPRLYITNIPPRWRDKTSKELDVLTKKRVFFRLLGPLVLPLQ